MNPTRSCCRLMPVLISILTGLWFTSPLLSGVASAFDPYTVYVSQESSHARCGPSPEHYRTDELRHGQALEVYGETEDGWLAIRPVDTSFCWVPADTVEMNPTGDIGTIIEEGTVAWIGTNLGRARSFQWQAQLTEGESVTVIGRSEREGPDGPQMWYRIVPPSGEFRFVHRDQVVRSSEELIASLQDNHPKQDIMFAPAGPTTRKPAARVASNRPKPRPRDVDAFDADAFKGDAIAKAPAVKQSGRSVLEAPIRNVDAEADLVPIGSGVRRASFADEPTHVESTLYVEPPLAMPPSLTVPEIQQAAASEPSKRKGLINSVAFLGRPRLAPIASQTIAPEQADPVSVGNDDNWTIGYGRKSTTPIASMPEPARLGQPVIQQASGIAPMPAQTLAPIPTTPAAPLNVVPAHRIEAVRAETNNASVERLTMILSRLMAAQASALEVEPVSDAARAIAVSTSDTIVAGQARLLADRADQYQRIATRRDGSSLVRGSGEVSMADSRPTISQAVAFAETQAQTQAQSQAQAPFSAPTIPPAPTPNFTGQLVQVYSARPNIPPYAITDHTGRTIAYVTPSPGVNLRNHLNSRVNVIGDSGYLPGLNMPHVLATGCVRAVGE